MPRSCRGRVGCQHSNLDLPDPKTLVTHMWPLPLDGRLFSKTGTCSKCQTKQREKEGAQCSVRAWRVAAPVPLSCLVPHFHIIPAFHMFTSHFLLLVLTLACLVGECWLEACFRTHHGGANKVLAALRAPDMQGALPQWRVSRLLSLFLGLGPKASSLLMGRSVWPDPSWKAGPLLDSFVSMHCSSFFLSTDIYRVPPMSPNTVLSQCPFSMIPTCQALHFLAIISLKSYNSALR